MRVTLYLLKLGVAPDKSALRNAGQFNEVSLQPADGLDWHLFVRSTPPRSVRWLDVLQPIVQSGALPGLRSQTSAAVLLTQRKDRVYAVTFGQGFHSIDPVHIERGFGLRVTANSVAVGQLTGADTRALSPKGRSQKVQLPAASELHSLGIEPEEDLVRRLSGNVAATDFASSAAGADSLRLNVKDFVLRDLSSKLDQVRVHYESQAYQQEFGFLDNFMQLDSKDPEVLRLDSVIESRLGMKDPELGFAAPDPFEQLDVDHYILKYRKSVRVDNLETPDVYSALDQLNLPAASAADKVRVTALNADDEIIDKDYRLHTYVQAEESSPAGRFVLTGGLWYRVAEDYVAEVKNYVEALPDVTAKLSMPDWHKASLDANDSDPTAEGSYNKLVARVEGYRLLDKKMAYIGGRNQKIEISDLLTSEKHLVCVKRATQSSTLSHLFAQGSVSAELMHDDEYQRRVVKELQEIDPSSDYGAPGEWAVVYAIATQKVGSLASSLFFFSQVNLMTHAKRIRGRGMKIALRRIQMI